jgi:hypothetical protein
VSREGNRTIPEFIPVLAIMCKEYPTGDTNLYDESKSTLQIASRSVAGAV